MTVQEQIQEMMDAWAKVPSHHMLQTPDLMLLLNMLHRVNRRISVLAARHNLEILDHDGSEM